MKNILINVLLAAFITACTDYVQQIDEREGEWISITDSRDGKTYMIVPIGTQIWMAQNLNYDSMDSYCYDDNISNCAKYGRLYMWTAAINVCPEGWHLPSQMEWNILFSAVGGSSVAGKMLKSIGDWRNENGNDSFSFSALPAGERGSGGGYDLMNSSAYYWSSSERDNEFAYAMNLNYYYDSAFLDELGKNYAFSVRCLKD